MLVTFSFVFPWRGANLRKMVDFADANGGLHAGMLPYKLTDRPNEGTEGTDLECLVFVWIVFFFDAPMLR